jgi:hypothetical protein
MIFATREKSRILRCLSPKASAIEANACRLRRKNVATTDGRSTIGMSRPSHARRDGPYPDNVGKDLPTYDHWSAATSVWRM